MLLKELFDKFVEYKGPFETSGTITYTFKIEDLHYVVYFAKILPKDIRYDFGDDVPEYVYEMTFGINLGYKIEKGIFDTKNPIEVFSTVMKIVKDHLAKNDYDYITLAGQGESRIRIYDRLIKKINNYTKVSEYNNKIGKNYILKKK